MRTVHEAKMPWLAGNLYFIQQDGARPHTANGTIDDFVTEVKTYVANLKTSGGCSLSESANEVGTMHKCLKGPACFGSDSFKYGEYEEPTDPVMLSIKSWLSQYIEKADMDTIWAALVQASEYITKSFNVMSIKKAFNDAGIYPKDNVKILNKCTLFRHFDEVQVFLY